MNRKLLILALLALFVLTTVGCLGWDYITFIFG